ncbi:acyltransferase [Paenibacillus herberti]|uniref:Acetyltransferase n=1 Tax=Paenibacillus herberti TaxID=1619309 RepID=A0A229NUW5_9BACL|nr:hypothetical protein CGZ75_22010 [Paenibacillus herberti]
MAFGLLKTLLKPSFWRYTLKKIESSYNTSLGAIPRLGSYGGGFIDSSMTFRSPENVHLGERVWINEGCKVWASKSSKVTIGAHTLLGPNAVIVADNHGIQMDAGYIQDQPMEEKDISIGPDCWIGANVVILAGVTVGEGAVVAASAVVNKDVPPYSIVGGVPAKVISHRKSVEKNVLLHRAR